MKSICVLFTIVVTIICGVLLALDIMVLTYPNFKLGLLLGTGIASLLCIGGTLLACGMLDGFDYYDRQRENTI